MFFLTIMKNNRKTRRNRFARSPVGKRLIIGTRDIAILQALYRFRFLRQEQLLKLNHPCSAKRLVERLGDLFHETGWLERPHEQWLHRNARSSPIIHGLSPLGREYLATQGKIPPRATTLSWRSRTDRMMQFHHAMLIIDTLFEIEWETRADNKQRFVPVDEILQRAPAETRALSNPMRVPVTVLPSPEFPMINSRLETHLIPDGLYGIEYKMCDERRYRFWALEAERKSPLARSNPKRSSLMLKEAAYNAFIKAGGHKRYWGIPNLTLHVVGSEGRDSL